MIKMIWFIRVTSDSFFVRSPQRQTQTHVVLHVDDSCRKVISAGMQDRMQSWVRWGWWFVCIPRERFPRWTVMNLNGSYANWTSSEAMRCLPNNFGYMRACNRIVFVNISYLSLHCFQHFQLMFKIFICNPHKYNKQISVIIKM